MIAHPFNPRSRRVDLREFNVSLVYKNSRTDRIPIQTDSQCPYLEKPCFENKKKKAFIYSSFPNVTKVQ